jgi:hypothetical protein
MMVVVEDIPGGLVGRDREWRALLEVVSSGHGVALVHGHHRSGVSALVTALADHVGGRVLRCGPGTRSMQLQTVAHFVDGEGANRPITGWSNAMERIRRMSVPLVVIDDAGHLLADAPDLAEALARSIDVGIGPVIVLAGAPSSAVLGVLGRDSPLFGKVALALSPSPLPPEDLARLWGADLPVASLWVDAALGPLPGYRPLVSSPGEDLSAWMCSAVLAANSPLLDAAAVGLPDQLRTVDAALGRSILDVVAARDATAVDVAEDIGVPVDETQGVLHALERAGTLVRVRDLVRERRDTYQLADPHLSFWLSVVARHRTDLAAGRAEQVWATTGETTFTAHVLPRRWAAVVRQHVQRHGVGSWESSPIAAVGATRGIDVVAVDSERTVVALGRTAAHPLGLDDLRQLQDARDQLGVPDAQLILASTADVDPAVEEADATVLTPGDVYGIA